MAVIIQEALSGNSVNLVRDLALGDDGDLVIAADISLVAGPAAAKQGVQIRTQFFQGEWFLDLDAGIPFWTRVLIKRPNLVEIREWFRLNIVATPDIASLTSLTLRYRKDRTLDVRYRAVLVTN